MLTNYNSTELKTQLPKLSQARQGIQKANDISGSVVKLHKTLTTIQPIMKKQQNYIRNFFIHQEVSNGQNKQLEMKRYINRICQLALNDISDMIDISQGYFMLDCKNSWTKIKNIFDKQFNKIRQELDQKNMIQFLFNVMNVKDYFFANFMKSLLYRQCLLWKDLNIDQSGFIHEQKMNVLQLIESEMLEKGYIPTKPIFNWMGLNVKGNWNMNKLDVPETNLKNILKIGNESMQLLMEVVRNYGNLSVEQRQHEDIDRNKNKIKSLREQIQQSRTNYMNLQKKYRQAILRDEKSDLVELGQKVSQLEQQLQSSQNELKKIKFQYRDSANQINSLKQKIRQLQQQLNQIKNQQMKKLKALQSVQNNLNDQFYRIYKNISNFSTMFQNESGDKKALAREIINQRKTIEKLANILGREKIRNRDLGDEIVRLNKIILELGEKLRKRE